MIVKTDISKAYDRMEWSFIRDMMQAMGFNSIWVNWIMMRIESVSFYALINGVLVGMIKTQTRDLSR